VQLRIVIQQVEGTLKGTTTGGWSNNQNLKKERQKKKKVEIKFPSIRIDADM
jgi:hypothetical protein